VGSKFKRIAAKGPLTIEVVKRDAIEASAKSSAGR